MVINLETPYYSVGEYGFIVEETLVVRETGAQLLTWQDHSFTTMS
jgi:Xaa-Pro aminopeptidase